MKSKWATKFQLLSAKCSHLATEGRMGMIFPFLSTQSTMGLGSPLAKQSMTMPVSLEYRMELGGSCMNEGPKEEHWHA